MLDFNENIELLEKVILNFVITPENDDVVIRPKNGKTIDKREILSHIKSSYFLDERYQEVIRVVKQYFKDFTRLPSKSEINGMMSLKNTRFTDAEINDVFNIDLSEYGYSFLYKYTESFILFRNFKHALTEMITDIKTKDITPDNINEVIDKAKNDMYTKLNINLSKMSQGSNFFNPKSHIQLPKTGSPTGFPFLDKVLGGGWNPKTLVVFQGRPKVGKTLVLANLAARSMLRGVNVGIATYEVSRQAYTKRVGSNILNIIYEDYDRITQDAHLGVIEQRLAALKVKHPNCGTLEIEEFSGDALEIETYFLRKEQELGVKFGLIVVDYLNLMESLKKEDNMYLKVKKISEELRMVARRNEWCIVTATQVKREAVGSNDMGMEDVAESFGLIHTVDSLFGLMRQPLEKIMKIKLIVNRDGGHTESYQRFDINYQHARLVEMTGPTDTYYSDDDQAAELEAEMLGTYGTGPSIEDELGGLLIDAHPKGAVPIATQIKALQEESFDTPAEDAPFDPDDEINLIKVPKEVLKAHIDEIKEERQALVELNMGKPGEEEESQRKLEEQNPEWKSYATENDFLEPKVEQNNKDSASLDAWDALDNIAESQPTSNFKKSNEYDDILNSL